MGKKDCEVIFRFIVKKGCLKINILLSKCQKNNRHRSEHLVRNRIKTIENIVSMRYLTCVRYDDMIVVFYSEIPFFHFNKYKDSNNYICL